jgi:hypothetical protein
MPRPRRKKQTEAPPAKPKPNLARLNKAEKRLVLHPPTPRTWVCRKKRQKDAGTEACGFVNSGRHRKCQLCAATKPSKPVLLWPLYLAACKKAGIDPKGAE